MDEFIDAWVARHSATRDQLLPLLHAIQEEAGYIDDSCVPAVAKALNLSRADVYGVITFVRFALPLSAACLLAAMW